MSAWKPLTDTRVAMRRAAMLERAREYFSDQGVLAVDTPALCRYPTSDPNIESLGVRGQPGLRHCSRTEDQRQQARRNSWRHLCA